RRLFLRHTCILVSKVRSLQHFQGDSNVLTQAVKSFSLWPSRSKTEFTSDPWSVMPTMASYLAVRLTVAGPEMAQL
ncbi:hypothetical protein, partial [Mycolicibacterium agri]|uniref:hypothetical protein n=1 Tax=Mycolicibacterium agri TaxID=36811 RepID=UPI001A9C8E87